MSASSICDLFVTTRMSRYPDRIHVIMVGEELKAPHEDGRALKLAGHALLPQSMNKDAWGRNILIANKLSKPTSTDVHPCLTEDEPNPDYPPYRMMLQSITPWGKVVTVCPVQSIN